MILTTRPSDFTLEIRKTDPHRHKYLSAMAEYLDYHMDSAADNGGTGDVDCATGHFARFGRRLLITDDRGFVWVEKYSDVRGAEAMYDALERYYDVWAEEEEDHDNPVNRADLLDLADRYLQYIAQNEVNNLEGYDYDRWVANGEPSGYLHSPTDRIGRYPLVPDNTLIAQSTTPATPTTPTTPNQEATS